LNLASRRQGKPVRLVWQSGQTDFVQNLPKDPKHLKSLSTSEQKKPWYNRDFLAQKPFSTAHRAKPVRPVFAWTVGKNTARGKNSTLPPIDLPIRSTDQSGTLGIVGVPRVLPLARSTVPETHSIKRNRKSTHMNTYTPRTPKPPKSTPLTHRFGRGITAQRTTKSSHKFPPSNPQEKGPENNPRKAPREDSENHHQEQPGQHNKALRNHDESSIHATKVHTRYSLPPDHPTL
jgi:hypothetical protein